ncbi:hypothetical protein ABPG73_007098 [Tetrahymena malaccensis]
MDMNHFTSTFQNNTELDFLGQKDQQSESIYQKPCWKGIIDERSEQIKQGLQGDSDFKSLTSQDDMDQENFSNKLKFSRQNQYFDKFQNISTIQLQQNRNKYFQQSVIQDELAQPETQNKYQINVSLSQQKHNQEKQDQSQSCNKQKNYKEENLKCYQKNGIQVINKQQNRNSVSTIANSTTKNEYNTKNLKNSLSKMVYIRINVLEFIKKLKQIYKNRKLENISKFQIELIADSSYYLESSQSQTSSILIIFLRRIVELMKQIPIFIPTNKIIILFDILTIIYLYLFFFFFSIIAFFNQQELNSNFFVFCCILTLSIMALDILVSLNLALFRRDNIISQRNYIVKKYILSFHFFTDFISILTMLTLTVSNPNSITYNPENNIWKYLSTILIFAKLYGIQQKVKRLEYVITLSQQSKRLYKLFCQIFSVLQIAHISCIGWYSTTFIQSDKTNWLQNINIHNSGYHIKYIYSFYWAIITMTTEDEVNSRLLKEEEQVLSILSTKLREEIILEANSQIIKNFDIFKCFSQQTINKLVFVMKEIIVSPGETIFLEGDLDDSVYLIYNGQIEIFQSGKQKNSQSFILKDLSNNQVFGEIAFFCQKPRSASAKSNHLSTLYKIERKDFMQIIQQNQNDFEIFKTIQHNITLNEDYKQAQLKCYSCKQSNHIIQNCPIVHQKFDHQLINLKQNFNNFQDRRTYQRQNSKLYSARILTSLNQRLLSQLKMEQEYQNFFNSVFENTQFMLSNMQIEEQRLQQEELNQNKDIQNQQSISSINNFDQVSISKRSNLVDQQFISSNKSQVQQAFNKGFAKEKIDFNINYVISDGSQIEKEQEMQLNLFTDEYTVQNYNSLGDLCNKNENPNNSNYSVNRNKKKSTILKHQNYIENIQIDQPKIQYDVNNLNDQESINLSSHLIAESYCSQEQKYHRQLSSISNLQLFPEDRKNKSCNPNFMDNKMSKIGKEEIKNNLKKDLYLLSQKSIKTNQEDCLNIKSQVQKIQKLNYEDKLTTMYTNRQSIQSTIKLFKNDFDQMKTYKYYFPLNNYNLVIKDYNFIQHKNLKMLISRFQLFRNLNPQNNCNLSKSKFSLQQQKQKNFQRDVQKYFSNISYGVSIKHFNTKNQSNIK